MKLPPTPTQSLWAIDRQGRLWQINTLNHRAAPSINIKHLPTAKQHELLNIVWEMWVAHVRPYRFRRQYKHWARSTRHYRWVGHSGTSRDRFRLWD